MLIKLLKLKGIQRLELFCHYSNTILKISLPKAESFQIKILTVFFIFLLKKKKKKKKKKK